MTFEIKTCALMPCRLSIFTINNKKAVSDDFGSSYDDLFEYIDETDDATEYGCTYRRWKRKNFSKVIAEKYSISQIEYNRICTELESKLTVGGCNLCE